MLAPHRKSYRTWLAGVILFLLGGVAGHGITLYLFHRHMDNLFLHPERIADDMASRIGSDFQLSDEKIKLIRRCLLSGHERMQALHQEERPKVEAIIRETEEGIMAVLPDDAAREKLKGNLQRYFPRPPFGDPHRKNGPFPDKGGPPMGGDDHSMRNGPPPPMMDQGPYMDPHMPTRPDNDPSGSHFGGPPPPPPHE